MAVAVTENPLDHLWFRGFKEIVSNLYSRVSHRLLDRQDLTLHEKMLAICLLRFDPCFVSYPRLAQMARMSERQVERTMPEVVKKLCIKVRKRRRGYLYDLSSITVTQSGVKRTPPTHSRVYPDRQTGEPPTDRRANKNKEKEQRITDVSDWEDPEKVRLEFNKIFERIGRPRGKK